MVTQICNICRRHKDATCTISAECAKAPKLNLGSGEMIKTEMVNFDMTEFIRPQGKTDVLGRIEDIMAIFPADYFAEILCAHVIEHFYKSDALKVIDNIRSIMRTGGKLVMEAPDLVGCYDYYITKLNNPEQFRDAIYGNEPHRLKWGNEWTHKWAYTREEMGKIMGERGFEIVHVGVGLTHGMGARDLRVEGIKQ
jgi:predicted SAM-dependent methyltransferase